MGNIINPDNIRAFDKKESDKIADQISNLKLDQSIVLETPAVVYDILGRFYKEENMLIKNIEYLGDSEYKLGFVFPPYQYLKKGMEHVSGVQMTLARFQALYVGIILAIKEGSVSSELTYDICLQNLYNVLYRGGTITHRSILYPGEIGYLIIKIHDVIRKGKFYTVECDFIKGPDVFLFGSEKCILEDRFINI